MYDPKLSAIIREAFLRLQVLMLETGPTLGQRISHWTRTVTKADHPEEAFKSPGSFPMLLFPWYAEQSLHPEPDSAFQADLVYSTVNGYFYIRLMDNLMDGHGEEGLDLMPALGFFHTQFQNPFLRYFKHDHLFWEFFNSTWLHSAEVTLRDAGLAQIDRALFEEVSAQKTCAAKIPIAAVFYRNEQLARMERWMNFVDLFGRWHQMWNDLFDWVKDTQYRTETYFLSEARRRMGPDEPLVDWVIREGFEWGMTVLDGWMAEMQRLVGELECPQLDDYLTERKIMLSNQEAGISQALEKSEKWLASLKNTFNRLEE